jgi:hypothetical protein
MVGEGRGPALSVGEGVAVDVAEGTGVFEGVIVGTGEVVPVGEGEATCPGAQAERKTTKIKRRRKKGVMSF